MPSVDDLIAELEADRASRESEIRLLEKLISSVEEKEADMLRRSMVLIGYAHAEGFAKFAGQAYVMAINGLGLKCKDVTDTIAAASLADVFAALNDTQRKHDLFRAAFPDDTALHRAFREQTFVAEVEKVFDRAVAIPDKAFDTQSNLTPDVLKKMLFKLGLAHEVAETHRSDIYLLVNVRNAIAHGDRSKVPKPEELARYMKAVFAVFAGVQQEVADALSHKRYLRAAVVATPAAVTGA